MEEVKKFIVAVEAMNHAYPRGRGGYDEYSGVYEYDLYFTEEPDLLQYEGISSLSKEYIEKLTSSEYDNLNEKLYEKLNPTGINVRIPSDCNYITCSFDGWSVIFTDLEGAEYEVDTSFTQKEKDRFEKVSDILR